MIGAKIRAAREALGLTQSELAGDAFSRSFISAVESGRVKPSAHSLALLAEHLGKPVSFFLPDQIEELNDRIQTRLDQAEALLALGERPEAYAVLDAININDDRLGLQVKASYHALSARLCSREGKPLLAVNSAIVSSDLFLSADDPKSAFRSLYACAHSLYASHLYSHAVEMGLRCLAVIRDRPEMADSEQITYYLLGSAEFALGRVSAARQYFASASVCTQNGRWDLTIRSLLGQASCAIESGDWEWGKQLSKEAARLAAQREQSDLAVEGMICSIGCLVKLGDYDEASAIVRGIERVSGADIGLKRKAYREYLLAMAAIHRVELVHEVEDLLVKSISADPDQTDWKVLKDKWALTAVELLRSPCDVQGVVAQYVGHFMSLNRHRDAADVLRFGASLLEKQGLTRDAYEMLWQASELHHKDNPAVQ